MTDVITKATNGREPAAADALPLLEQALLWSMRAWALGNAQPDRRDVVEHRLAGMFGSLRIAAGGVGALDAFMGALRNGASRMLEVNCVCHDGVSGDELLLLDVLALEAAHRESDAVAVLGRMVDQRWAAIGCDAAGRLMALLTAMGHSMPRTEDAVRRHAFAGRTQLEGPASLH